jgi:hypothetical protein
MRGAARRPAREARRLAGWRGRARQGDGPGSVVGGQRGGDHGRSGKREPSAQFFLDGRSPWDVREMRAAMEDHLIWGGENKEV